MGGTTDGFEEMSGGFDNGGGTVVLSVSSRAETSRRLVAAMEGETQGSHITFPSVELLWRVVTPKRLAVLRALAGGEAAAIREVARRVERDVKAVHGDVHALIDAGLIDDAGRAGVRFPYDAVRVEFTVAEA